MREIGNGASKLRAKFSNSLVKPKILDDIMEKENISKLIDEVKNELKANLDIDKQGRVKTTAHANAVKGFAG